jgi:peptidoglycan/xylan/chitin deacetylase (PgdA/CDA1 family)
MLFFIVVGFGVFVLLHTAPGPLLIDKINSDRAIWRMPTLPDRDRVYLTFDDGPNPTATPALLDVLRREQVQATFFLIDKHVTAETAPIVTRMAAEGHGVALHSHTRVLMFLTPDALAARLTASADHIERLSGTRPCPAFRPHAGFRSQSMYDGLARLDHVLVGWGWNLWDWNWFRRRDARTIVPRLTKGVSDGDIVVIHDGHHENPRADRRYAVETTAQLIPALRARGFEFATICGDLRERRASMPARDRVSAKTQSDRRSDLPPRPQSVRASSGDRRSGAR